MPQITTTPPYHLGDIVASESTQYPQQLCERVPKHTMQISSMEVEEEVHRPFERVAHRSTENSSAAPVTAATGTQASIMCFLR